MPDYPSARSGLSSLARPMDKAEGRDFTWPEQRPLSEAAMRRYDGGREQDPNAIALNLQYLGQPLGCASLEVRVLSSRCATVRHPPDFPRQSVGAALSKSPPLFQADARSWSFVRVSRAFFEARPYTRHPFSDQTNRSSKRTHPPCCRESYSHHPSCDRTIRK